MSKLIYKLSKDGKSYKVTGMEKIPYEVEYDAFDGKKHTHHSYRFDIGDTLEIPQMHNGLPVIEITKDAFANDVFTISGKIFKSHNIKKVILPNGFKIIGKYAFIKCVNLKEIIIPNSVTKVDKGAFMGCYNLEAIKFSEKMKEISEHTCCGCNTLKEISIPSSIKSIGQYAFNGMTGVPDAHKFRAESTYVAIPSSVIKIGLRAFGNYKNLTIDVCGHETKPDGWDEEWCYGTKYSNIDGVVKVNWNT
jgi:hypothetical protein